MYKTLVIGGSSKIGRYLRDKNTLLTYNRNKIKNGIKLDLNINSFIKLYNKYKFEKIFYFAAISKIDACLKKNSHKLNLNYPKKLINFLSHKNIYFIYASSDAVYGEMKNKVATENCSIHPINQYGKQKNHTKLKEISSFNAIYFFYKILILSI